MMMRLLAEAPAPEGLRKLDRRPIRGGPSSITLMGVVCSAEEQLFLWHLIAHALLQHLSGVVSRVPIKVPALTIHPAVTYHFKIGRRGFEWTGVCSKCAVFAASIWGFSGPAENCENVRFLFSFQMFWGAPKERRRRHVEKRFSKRMFLESPFLLCPFKVCSKGAPGNLKGAEKKRTLQKRPFYLDDRQITHLICARLKYDLYDFFWRCFGPASFLFLV